MMKGADLLAEFQQNFNEDDYIPLLESMKWPAGFCCSVCGNREAYRIKTRNLPLFECKHCRHQQSLISNTIMHKSKTPIWKWLFVIYSIHKHDSGLNAVRLSELIKVTYKTAWTMLHKVRAILCQTTQTEQAAEVEIKHEIFRLQLFPTDARLAKERSVAVVKAKLGNDRYQYRFFFIPRQKQAREPLTNHEQSLLLRDLGLAECENAVINPRFQQGKRRNFIYPDSNDSLHKFEDMTLSEVANDAFAWINETFNGLSMKYAERYLNEYCYRLNSLFESSSTAFQQALRLALQRNWGCNDTTSPLAV